MIQFLIKMLLEYGVELDYEALLDLALPGLRECPMSRVLFNGVSRKGSLCTLLIRIDKSQDMVLKPPQEFGVLGNFE